MAIDYEGLLRDTSMKGIQESMQGMRGCYAFVFLSGAVMVIGSFVLILAEIGARFLSSAVVVGVGFMIMGIQLGIHYRQLAFNLRVAQFMSRFRKREGWM